MTKYAILLFYATIAGSFFGSLAESPGSQTKLENIEGQVNSLRMGQDKTERQLETLLQKLSRIESFLENMALNKTANSPKFEKIGSRFFYIESEDTETWHNAGNTCVRMGGHLASIQNEEELSLITRKLQEGKGYWLDINDQAIEGEFMSGTTNRMAPFMKWKRNHPNDLYGNRDCVLVDRTGSMADYVCNLRMNFICEADINE